MRRMMAIPIKSACKRWLYPSAQWLARWALRLSCLPLLIVFGVGFGVVLGALLGIALAIGAAKEVINQQEMSK